MNILEAKNRILDLNTQVLVNPDNSVYTEYHSVRTALLQEQKQELENILTQLADTSWNAALLIETEVAR